MKRHLLTLGIFLLSPAALAKEPAKKLNLGFPFSPPTQSSGTKDSRKTFAARILAAERLQARW